MTIGKSLKIVISEIYMVSLLVLTVKLIQLGITLEASLNEESSSLNKVGLCTCLWGIILTGNWCVETQSIMGDNIPEAGVRKEKPNNQTRMHLFSLFSWLWVWLGAWIPASIFLTWQSLTWICTPSKLLSPLTCFHLMLFYDNRNAVGNMGICFLS